MKSGGYLPENKKMIKSVVVKTTKNKTTELRGVVVIAYITITTTTAVSLAVCSISFIVRNIGYRGG